MQRYGGFLPLYDVAAAVLTARDVFRDLVRRKSGDWIDPFERNDGEMLDYERIRALALLLDTSGLSMRAHIALTNLLTRDTLGPRVPWDTDRNALFGSSCYVPLANGRVVVWLPVYGTERALIDTHEYPLTLADVQARSRHCVLLVLYADTPALEWVMQWYKPLRLEVVRDLEHTCRAEVLQLRYSRATRTLHIDPNEAVEPFGRYCVLPFMAYAAEVERILAPHQLDVCLECGEPASGDIVVRAALTADALLHEMYAGRI